MVFLDTEKQPVIVTHTVTLSNCWLECTLFKSRLLYHPANTSHYLPPKIRPAKGDLANSKAVFALCTTPHYRCFTYFSGGLHMVPIGAIEVTGLKSIVLRW